MIGFSETSYGIVKRLRVVRTWVNRIQQRTHKSKLHILDYGCGTGDHLTYPLAADGHTVCGMDSHEPSIIEATRRYPCENLQFKTGSLSDILAAGKRFDAIICSEVIEHVDDPGSFLKDLAMLMVNDGGLIVTTPNGYGSYEWLSALQRSMQKTSLYSRLRDRASKDPAPAKPAGFINLDSGHIHFFTISRLQSLFSDAGLAVADRRARTLLCGPFADVAMDILPFRGLLYRFNAALADVCPFRLAADWMFLLEKDRLNVH